MNYYGPKELAASFRTVRNNTIIIAEEIGEDHYGFSPASGTRTVAQTLFHISVAPNLQYQIHAVEHRATLEGFDFPAFLGKLIADEQTPRSKQQIVALLREEGDRFGQWIETLSDDFLGEQVRFPAGMTPPSKSRFEMILGIKEHEMHHRGQLMLVERMLGMVPHLTRQMLARIAAMQAAKVSA
jgi:uncharacterized damage-inducible protein DinB